MLEKISRFGRITGRRFGAGITVLWGGLMASSVLAATSPAVGIDLSGKNAIENAILCPIFNTFFWVVLAVSMIMVLWGGFKYVKAGDDTEATSSARKTVTWAAVGIAVALIAKGFPGIIGSIFSVSGLTSC